MQKLLFSVESLKSCPSPYANTTSSNLSLKLQSTSWWQLWDLDDRFRMLVTDSSMTLQWLFNDSSIWKSHHYEKGHQHYFYQYYKTKTPSKFYFKISKAFPISKIWSFVRFYKALFCWAPKMSFVDSFKIGPNDNFRRIFCK